MSKAHTMTQQPSVSLDAEIVRQRLEAAFERSRNLMREKSKGTSQREQFHGMAQGILVALHVCSLLDDETFDARVNELGAEL